MTPLLPQSLYRFDLYIFPGRRDLWHEFITGYGRIILKVNFPRQIAVMSGLMMSVVNLVINFL